LNVLLFGLTTQEIQNKRNENGEARVVSGGRVGFVKDDKNSGLVVTNLLIIGAGRAAQCGRFGNVQTRPHAYDCADTHTPHLMTVTADSDTTWTPPPFFLPRWAHNCSLSSPFAVPCPKIYTVSIYPTTPISFLFRLVEPNLNPRATCGAGAGAVAKRKRDEREREDERTDER
jgi:hypothetical protein